MITPRRLLATLTAASLLAAPTAANAATSAHRAHARTVAVELSLFENVVGSPLLTLGATDALTTSAPLANAAVAPIAVAGMSLPGIGAEASSTGAPVAVPTEGDGCVVPVALTGLTVEAICSSASAEGAADPADQSALAVLDLATVAADGRFVADLLTSELDELLESILDGIGADVLTDAIDQVRTACDDVYATLTGPILDPLDVLPATVEELLDTTGLELDAAILLLDTLTDGELCTALLDLSVLELTEDLVDLDPLADALEELDLIQVSLNDARSWVNGGGSTLEATAETVFVSIDGPSLGAVDDVIVGVVEGVLDGIVEELEVASGQDFTGDLGIPDQLTAALDMIPLLDETAPLLTVVAAGGSPTAAIDLDGAQTNAGGDEPYVLVSIAPSVLELFGADPEMGTQTLTAGQTQVIAEGTPLESTISVGDLIVTDGVEDEDGLVGTVAEASVTTLSLLSGLEGGVELTVGGGLAETYVDGVTVTGTPDPAPDPEDDDPELPVTGGGAVLAASVALAGAFALRRRRQD